MCRGALSRPSRARRTAPLLSDNKEPPLLRRLRSRAGAYLRLPRPRILASAKPPPWLWPAPVRGQSPRALPGQSASPYVLRRPFLCPRRADLRFNGAQLAADHFPTPFSHFSASNCSCTCLADAGSVQSPPFLL